MKEKNLLILLLFFSYFVSYGQSHPGTISGKITDSDGQGIPGATVVLKGTTRGTISDLDGLYSLQDVKATDVIVFSFIGYKTQEFSIGDKTVINVVMTPDNVKMEEVVVVGYGVQKKESSVAAIEQVDGDQLKKASAVSLSNALTGQVQGVFTVQSSGQPGSDGASVFIRGKSSWENNAPLVLIDGVEGSYNDIDANEIASISVLKDASATAIFGVKGANGVILITTKRGKEGDIEVTFSSEFGLKDPLLNFHLLDSYGTALLMNEAYKNDGDWGSILSDEVLEHYRLQDEPYLYPNTDWTDLCIKNFGISDKQSISVSGGTGGTKVYASFSHLYDGDIFKTQKQEDYDPTYKYNRYNYRVNLDFDITNTTVLSIDAGGFIGIRNQPNETGAHKVMRSIYVIGPMIPYEYPASVLDEYPDYAHPDETGTRIANSGQTNTPNPYAILNYSGSRTTKATGLNTSIVLKQDLDFITKGLSIQGKVAFNHEEAYTKAYNYNVVSYQLRTDGTWVRYVGRENTDSESAQLPLSIGSEDISSNPFRSWYYEASVRYSRNFNGHNVSGLFLGQRRKSQTNVAYPHYEQGVVGRATYDYKTKYLFEFNLGFNGSEQFAPGNRYGFFPSYAVGWNLHQERFMSFLKPWISRLKVKYSYGEVGSDNASGDRWLYTTSYSNGSRNPNTYKPGTASDAGSDVTPINEGKVANKDATWERAKKQDLGFEVGFLKNNMFLLTMDFFKEKRDHILLDRLSVPDWFGVDAKQQNLGKTETKGYELELKYTKRTGRNFEYWAKAGVSFSDNRIINKDEPYYKVANLKQEGRRIDQCFGYVSTGYIDNVDERAAVPRYGGGLVGLGDVVYVDFNGDGSIDQNDQVPMGYAGTYPLYFDSFSAGLTYKGFDFSLMFQGAQKVSRHLMDALLWPLHRLTNQCFDYETDYWTPTNTDASYPSLHMDSNRTHNNIVGGAVTTTSMIDGSYFRLKMAQIAYTLPKSFTSRLNIKKCRVYIQGNNLYTWTKHYPFGDPESYDIGNGAISDGSYPIIRKYTLGLQVSF